MLENNIENNTFNSKNIDGITHETLDKYFESESKDEGISWDELSESFSTWIEDTKNSTIEGLVSVLPVSIIQLLANHGLIDNIDRADSTALAEIEIEKWQQINTNEIPIESISELPDILIKNMSIDQLSNLSSEQIKFLSPTQVSELSSEQLSSLGEKILSLSDINIKSLTSNQLEDLAETGNLQFINPNMISTESLKGWDDYSVLPKEYIAYIPAEEFKTIDLSSFTVEKINLFSTEQFQNITITNLTPVQLQGLSKELTLTLSNTDIQSLLNAGTLSNINPESISPSSLEGLRDYSSLPPEYIQYIPISEFKNIDISNFTKEQIEGITKEQLDMLPMDETIKTFSKYFPEYDWENIKTDAIDGATVGAVIGGVVGAGAGFIVGGPIGAAIGGTKGAAEGAILGGVGSATGEGARQTAIHNGASENVANAIEIGTDIIASAGIAIVPMLGKEGIEQAVKHGDELLDAIKNIGKQEVTELPTINKHLAGSKHPDVDIEYLKKVVETPHGKIEGVFPKFESKYDYYIPKEYFDADGIVRISDIKQFKEATNQLLSDIEKNPLIAKNFTKEHIEQIKFGILPKDFTWHHNEETGLLQLVDSVIHDTARHTGGAKLWTSRHES